MKDLRVAQAIVLRKQGFSVKSIARELNAAQSSVSKWVHEVTLSEGQIEKLKANTHSPEAIHKRRQSRLKNELTKRMQVINSAKESVEDITNRELWLIGTALYWAEGTKRQGQVAFSNGDPRMITLMMRFFRDICRVDETKLRGYIHIHEHLDAQAAELYWQEITGIKSEKFYKTYNKPNKSSKGLRNSLPYGVCDIYVMDANLHLKIRGWTDGIYHSVTRMV